MLILGWFFPYSACGYGGPYIQSDNHSLLPKLIVHGAWPLSYTALIVLYCPIALYCPIVLYCTNSDALPHIVALPQYCCNTLRVLDYSCIMTRRGIYGPKGKAQGEPYLDSLGSLQ